MEATEGAPGTTGEEGAPTLRHRAEYLFARAAGFVLLCTDLRGASRIGRLLGRILGAVDRRHRLIAEDNVRRAYGGSLPEAEVRRLVRRVYEGLGITVAEVLHGPRRFRGRAERKWFRFEGGEELRRAVGDRPVVLLGAHFGNWEYLATAARLAGLPSVSVARPLDNPLLDRWVAEIRGSLGNVPLEKEGALRGLIRAVRDGRNVGMLVDQNGGRHGRIAPFFGRPCSTQSAGVSLARRLGVPFSIGTLERRAPGFHRFVLGPPVYVRDDDAGEQEAIEEMNRQLEARVRRRPEDWMWLHRRWRIKADWGFPVEPTEPGGGNKRKKRKA
jgi:KDO2-lipid IV(A) lauroyltransferase